MKDSIEGAEKRSMAAMEVRKRRELSRNWRVGRHPRPHWQWSHLLGLPMESVTIPSGRPLPFVEPANVILPGLCGAHLVPYEPSLLAHSVDHRPRRSRGAFLA